MRKILVVAIAFVILSLATGAKLKGRPPVSGEIVPPVTPTPYVPFTPMTNTTITPSVIPPPVIPPPVIPPSVIPSPSTPLPVTPSMSEENLPITPVTPINRSNDWRLTVHDEFSFILRTYNNYRFLTDQRGWSLYIFTADTPGNSTCFEDCEISWPPVLISSMASVTPSYDIRAEYLSTFIRPDGRVQLVYNGYPLYYYMKDVVASDIRGQAVNSFGGFWYLIGSDGVPIRHPI